MLSNNELLTELHQLEMQVKELESKLLYMQQEQLAIHNKLHKLRKKSFSKRLQRILKKIQHIFIKIGYKNSKLQLRILGIKLNFNQKKINKNNPFGYFKYSYNNFFWFKDELEHNKKYTVNLGDNIQALAIKQLYQRLHLKNITSIDRDKITTYQGSKINLLMNAVFSGENFPLPKKINPIFLGFNVPNKTIILQNKEIFKKYEPIGCRDCYTAQMLRECGISSYVTGCYSLMFPKRTPMPTQKKVFFVGVSEELKKHIPSELLKNAEFIIQRDESIHYPLTEQDMQEKEQKAQILIEKYKNEAKLVVTSLLHCASPCIGMGIPVILARDAYDERFSAIKKITPLYLKENYSEINWHPEIVDVEELKQQMFKHAQERILNNEFDKQSYKYLEKVFERSPDKLIHNTWTKEMQYSEIMENRIKKILSLFDVNEYKSVMDLGCGKQTLKNYLPKTIKYIPVDQHNHIATTIIKDFNKGEFLYEKVDAVFCLGVFEYIYDLPAFVKKIASVTNTIIGSYIFYGDRPKPEYVVNKYTEEEFWEIFSREGFEVIKYVPEDAKLQIGRNSLYIMKKKS